MGALEFYIMKQKHEMVLLGHNSSIFDTPVLLRNSGTDFTERLQKMDICLLILLCCSKHLSEKNCHVWKIPMARFQNPTNPRCTTSCLPDPSKHMMH